VGGTAAAARRGGGGRRGGRPNGAVEEAAQSEAEEHTGRDQGSRVAAPVATREILPALR
jgi:hypothetical protein